MEKIRMFFAKAGAGTRAGAWRGPSAGALTGQAALGPGGASHGQGRGGMR